MVQNIGLPLQEPFVVPAVVTSSCPSLHLHVFESQIVFCITVHSLPLGVQAA